MLVDEFGKVVKKDGIEDKKIVFFGASTRNSAAISDMKIKNQVLFWVDSDDKKVGTRVDGYDIFSLEKIKEIPDCIIMTVLTRNKKEVLESIRTLGNNKCVFYIHEVYNIRDVAKENMDILKQRKRYKYIHIFSNDKFIKFFYSMIEERFQIEEHLFIVEYRLKDESKGAFGYKDIKVRNERNHNILVLDSVHDGLECVCSLENCNLAFETEDMKQKFESTCKIIFHSAFWANNGKKLVKSLVDKVNGKIVWICWGGDSYYDKESDIVQGILRKIRCAYAAEERTNRIRKEYEIPVKSTKATYTYTSVKLQNRTKISEENLMEKEAINILLGHSAYEYGNHKVGFELLKKYRYENIRIFCPLSYGEEIYRDKVIREGKAIFGDKFVPILKFMEQEEYYEFLDTIDIAVFPLTRMAAGTTLTYLNAIGKKIYMSIEQAENFSNFNIKAEDIYDIVDERFEEFVTYSALDSNEKIKNIEKLNNKVVSEWNKIMEIK